jgi:hypothetical protein
MNPDSNTPEPIHVGDYVRSSKGWEGKVIAVHRVSAFVETTIEGESHTLAILLSELTKIDPPSI